MAAAWATSSTLKSFTTLFGTALNGSEITWYNGSDQDSSSTDRTELKIKWTQNLFSSLYTWYDSADASDTYYYQGHFDYTGQADGAYTPANDVTGAAPQTDYHSSSFLFHMQLQNPVSTATPQYDGMWALYKQVVTLATGPPRVTDTSIVVSRDTQGQTDIYDLVPASDYDLTLDEADGTCTGATSQWTNVAHPSDDADNCDTLWRIGANGVACVQVTAYFTRLREIETTEATCDFTIEYSDHVVSITQGQVGASGHDYTAMKFSQTVSFGQFPTLAAATTSSAVSGLIPSIIVGLASMLALSGF